MMGSGNFFKISVVIAAALLNSVGAYVTRQIRRIDLAPRAIMLRTDVIKVVDVTSSTKFASRDATPKEL